MEKPRITVTGVLALLNEGKSRKEIAEHFGISGVDCKALFQHPDLKGKKAKKQRELGFVLVDDLNPTDVQEQVASTEQVENQVEVEADPIADATPTQTEGVEETAEPIEEIAVNTTSNWEN